MRMSDDEIDAFLKGGRRVQVATLDGGGQIDGAMSYLFWNGRLALWTDPASQKIRNLRRNPHIACLVEAGDQFENFRAVQLRGRAEPIDDLQSSRRAGELLFARHGSGACDRGGPVGGGRACTSAGGRGHTSGSGSCPGTTANWARSLQTTSVTEPGQAARWASERTGHVPASEDPAA